MELVRVSEYERFLGVLRSADAEAVDLDAGTDCEWAARRESIMARETDMLDEEEAGTRREGPSTPGGLIWHVLPLIAVAAGVQVVTLAGSVLLQVVGCFLVVCAFVSALVPVGGAFGYRARPPQRRRGVRVDSAPTRRPSHDVKRPLGQAVALALTGVAVTAVASLSEGLRH